MSGELKTVRRTRDEMARKLRDGGASPDWARRKATEAALRYDRKVRSGDLSHKVRKD